MAVSELQSRLEHLVTYSSQLIFISGDSVASQQRSLQAFVSQQSDNTEIAFINAEPEYSIAQYRQQIVRQLLGADAPLLNRPLNELLSALNQHDGPVLIFICEAQHIPQKFLQELWELVLQSRFAANKQHLNVLLFGETQWTEQAKAWLPANNRDKPLLLSTESISSQSQPAPSELDRMIAEKRRQFEQRLKDRATAQVPPPSNLSTWWFRLIVAFAFLSVFAGILLWQYSDQFGAVVEKISDQGSQSTKAIAANGEPELATPPANELTTLQQQNTPDATDTEEDLIKYEVVEQPAQSTEKSSTISMERDKQQLVTTWQQAVSDMRNASSESQLKQASEPLADPDVVELSAATQSSDFIERQSKATEIEDEPAFPQDQSLSDTLDYQVEDIVSVDQLPQPATGGQTTVVAAENENLDDSNLAPLSSELSEPAASQPPEQTSQALDTPVVVESATRDNLVPEANPETPLQSLPKDHFVIQIAGLRDQQLLQEFLTDNAIQDQVWIYQTQRYGGDWFVVIYAASYPDIEQARQGMIQLSEAMQRGTPFVKSVNRVHIEMQIQ